MIANRGTGCNSPVLIGAFAFGPVTGVMVELVKNLLGLMTSSTGGVGELANFLMGASYVFTAGAVYTIHTYEAGCGIV